MLVIKHPDVKKRIKLAITRAKLKKRIARKSQRTKRINPASRRVPSIEQPNEETLMEYCANCGREKHEGRLVEQFIDGDNKSVEIIVCDLIESKN